MGQRLTLAVQGKMDVVKINGYDDDDDDDQALEQLCVICVCDFVCTLCLSVTVHVCDIQFVGVMAFMSC